MILLTLYARIVIPDTGTTFVLQLATHAGQHLATLAINARPPGVLSAELEAM